VTSHGGDLNLGVVLSAKGSKYVFFPNMTHIGEPWFHLLLLDLTSIH